MFAHILRVPHRLQIVRDGKYGGKTTTGEWNGMIGELTNRVRRKMRRGTCPDPGFCRGAYIGKKVNHQRLRGPRPPWIRTAECKNVTVYE